MRRSSGNFPKPLLTTCSAQLTFPIPFREIMRTAYAKIELSSVVLSVAALITAALHGDPQSWRIIHYSVMYFKWEVPNLSKCGPCFDCDSLWA